MTTDNPNSMLAVVIEDRSAIRTVFTSLLTRMGHKAEAFDNFEQAFDFCNKQTVDAIFVDMDVKGLESLGAKALSLLRATQLQWIPILAMSMQHKPKEFLAHIEAGADDCLFKPIDPDYLKAKLLVIERIFTYKQNNCSI